MLPFYMRSYTLILMMAFTLLGQLIWVTAASTSWKLNYDRRALILAFAIGIVLGFIHGRFVALLFSRYYIDAVTGRVNLWHTALGKGTTIFVILALGIPILWNILVRAAPSGLQSYIFGFILGMNMGIYLWVRQLPK